ncbi:branched-chain amino acid transport system II carrier protein [Vagococcus sp.]|uniref:branched-chain amino acid transport system II carrier protein n=1 Tax=Vagococcus sp. TaxID=1933889 RepID=UPI003F980031
MKKQLKWTNYLSIGFMIFGLFFGAGNLIFPIQMGQEAGQAIGSANIGFLLTGIGLPFLGILAFGYSGSESVFDLASKVNQGFAYLFTTILFLIIGPLFALPRLATTSFEVGLSGVISQNHHPVVLLIFSCLFFLLSWFLSLNPTKLIDYIGRFLTPLFLILLFILLSLAFIFPLGAIKTATIQPSYAIHPFVEGFLNGYNTLDALAALAFGTIVVKSVQSLGDFSKKEAATKIAYSGLIGVVLMGVIYTLLSYTGVMSLGEFPLNKNGGITLSQISTHYLGTFGYWLMTFIVFIACLKTAIGLISAFAQTFTKMYPKFSYRQYCGFGALISALIANVGLTTIITLSKPVLMFIYPLAMLLIMMSLFHSFFEKFTFVYQYAIYFTMVASFLEALNALPESMKNQFFMKKILEKLTEFLPLYEFGFSWIIFAVIGVLIGLIVSQRKGNVGV